MTEPKERVFMIHNIPEDLRTKLKVMAILAKPSISMNDFIIKMLTEAVNERKE